MSRKKLWLLGVVALASALGFASDAGAQPRIAVKPRPTVASISITGGPTAQLTADLAAVVAAKQEKARLIGVNVQGEAIVEFGADVTPQAAIAALAEAPRNLDTRVHLEEQPFRPVTKLIVVYSGKAAPQEVGGMKVVDSHPEGQFVVVQSEDGFSAEQIERLAADEKVRLVQPNYVYQLVGQPTPAAPPTKVPNDPLFPQLWGMRNIHAPTAWHKIVTSPVLVAVIDTGINLQHKDLMANIAPGLSKDFTTDNSVMDVQGHGSHCAGTIAAVGNNKLGVVGVMWKGRVFSAKIFGKTGFAGDIQVAKAIDYAVAKGAKVLSNSWGGGAASPVLQAAIARADLKGVLFIAAAGNFGQDNDVTPFYPASYPNKNIISVLAINVSDKKSSFSHFGKTTVDIGAPGEGILSTHLGQTFKSLSGTSMATPHVSGAAALIWGHPKFQSLKHTQIKALILKNARLLSDLSGKCVTGGTLDIGFLGALPPVPAEIGKKESKKD
ncbi:MAG TPA: S8 family peptidase [Gemmataceae bacterium]|nr:S8 family peptidase [Gemmataceae bacterium]